MPRRRSPLPLLALAAVAACGAPRSPVVSTGDATSTIRVAGGGGSGTMLSTVASPTGLVDSYDAPLDAVWAALPAVYTELGIDFTTLDQTRRVIGNNELRVRQQLGKVPLSRYVACGAENGRDNADSYAVTLSVNTQVVPGEGGATRAVSVVQGTARSLLFSNGDVACASTQRLESRIADLLRARLEKR